MAKEDGKLSGIDKFLELADAAEIGKAEFFMIETKDAVDVKNFIEMHKGIKSPAQLLGSLTSEAKKKSSALNGSLGGRPAKNKKSDIT